MHTAKHRTPQYLHQSQFLRHANGTRRLDSILLVVADRELYAYRDRYTALLNRSAMIEGPRHVFALRVGRVEIIPGSALDQVLPGETAPVLPFFAAQAVTVADLGEARKLLDGNGFTPHELPDGFFVSTEDAGGPA